MAHETRVNLRRLLHDIRDAYAAPLEEVIVTELIANALDSGATRIEFVIDTEQGRMRCVDNGAGMRRATLKEYHDIAASTKERGLGIGFAGIGAKLSLLVADNVVTETRGPNGSRGATHWHLTSTNRAPWKFIPSPGYVTTPRGTAVQIVLSSPRSSLCDPISVSKTILRHFFPLLDSGMKEKLLRLIYPKGIVFIVNGEELCRTDHTERHYFKVSLGKQNTRPVGIGYLVRSDAVQSPTGFAVSGLAVSTYGKIIKHGWEWLGLMPKLHAVLSGVVEIPGLSEILTTNKSDFLNDATSLKKYYRLRKATQEAILSLLPELGEPTENSERPISKETQTLSREIESALGAIADDFPELLALFGVKHKKVQSPAVLSDHPERQARDERINGIEKRKLVEKATSLNKNPREEILHLQESTSGEYTKTVRKKSPGIKITLQEFTEEGAPVLGRIIENTVFVNTKHPAWKRATEEHLNEYHVVLTVACVLSELIEQTHSPHDFIGKFLASWGQSLQQKLF
ncbi:MAG: ATP-binding protein [Candidatus Uhrbacteria bacterium]|nr:ATP-binding protein [Candidatus Uhrbacteria bacterium]